MSDKLTALLDRLKARQRDLIVTASETDALPAASVLRQIAELENAIAAVEAVAGEEADQRRRGGQAGSGGSSTGLGASEIS